MKKEEIISLTEKLHEEFEIVQLEERLETDPLAVMGMFGIESPMQKEMIVILQIMHVRMFVAAKVAIILLASTK